MKKIDVKCKYFYLTVLLLHFSICPYFLRNVYDAIGIMCILYFVHLLDEFWTTISLIKCKQTSVFMNVMPLEVSSLFSFNSKILMVSQTLRL
jgi:hypothetical protein